MNKSELIEALEALTGRDGEGDHVLADDLLLEALRSLGGDAVALAYEAARKRCGFWYA